MNKYTAEMALCEIWVALQAASEYNIYDFLRAKTIAKRAIQRVGLLEEGGR